MTGVVSLPVSPLPAFAELAHEVEAQAAASAVRDEPLDLDLMDARQRAQAVRGAMSTCDLCAVTGAEFWAICEDVTRPLYLSWARRSLAMFEDIVREGERP